MSKRLGKTEWIDAGLKALAAGGVDSVKVEKLAKVLGVTKGSFYWHFENRDALLGALLETWQARATNDIIAEVEQTGGDGKARLRSLFAIVLCADGRLDHHVRVWASKDAAALVAMESIDKRRLKYLQTLFSQMGFAASEGKARARLIYHALIGQFTMGRSVKRNGELSPEFESVFQMLVRKPER